MANKKINQLVAKTTIQSTDLFPLGDASTGQLFKKTIAELQAAIGGAVISVNGLVGTVVLDTDDIQELASPTNRYFTEARARAAISLTTTGSSGASTYSSSTGVLNVPTYTLAGLGGISASFLSGGTGITYNSSTGVISYSGTVYTDASVRALVSAGAGISYNSSTGAISYSGTVYTDSSIRALISLTTNGSSGASTYNNTTGVLNVPTYTLAGLGGISLTSLSGTAPITYNSSTGAIGITQASTSTNGFLSSTDWNTFNGKQSALTLGNVSEVVSNVLMFPDGGTNKTIGNLTIQVVQAGSTTNGFLSTTDWNTFNNKQGAITLTTTGTLGAATFSGGTLNIPQYQGAITLTTTGTSGAATLTGTTLNIPQYQALLTNPVTGTGTTNFVTKWTSSSALGNSVIQENSGSIGINGAAVPDSGDTRLQINATTFATLNLKSTNVNANIRSHNTNGGFYLGTISNHFVSIFTNDAVRMTITAAGNVGIGTSSPTALLHVNGISRIGNTAASAQLQILSPNGHSSFIYFGEAGVADRGVVGFSNGSGDFVYRSGASTLSDGTERMRITSTGNVGIGTTNPSGTLEVAAPQFPFIVITGTNSTQIQAQYGVNQVLQAAYFGTNTNHTLVIHTNGIERGRVTAGGNWLLGTTTDNGERLYVSGSIRATGSITANSDVRLKKNIERIENALQKVSEISGYTYNTIYDEDRHAGVIAQEIDKVLPEIVNKGNDGLMGVEYGNISALLIEAIKDLKVQNDSLQARLSALEK